MADLDGNSAARQLRSKGFDKPIIALTAMVDDKEQCIATRWSRFERKPIDRVSLLATCKSALQSSNNFPRKSS